MPSLAVAIVAKKDKVAKNVPIIPPDLVSALELLFFLEEVRTGQVPPTPAWFLAEAFASQQYRAFKPTELQNFLQGLLGPAYSGAESIMTYYAVVAMALFAKAVLSKDIAAWQQVRHRCEGCLMYWGVRSRQEYMAATEGWMRRTHAEWERESVGNGGNPNVSDRGSALLYLLRTRVGKLVKKLQFE